MIAVNHMLVGVTLGVFIQEPLIAGPLAVASHFVLDALPQFGYSPEAELRRYGSWYFKLVLISDTTLVTLLLGTLVYFGRFDLIVFALLAYSPDVLWIYKFVVVEKYGTQVATRPLNFFTKFHASIQRFEYPWMFGPEIIFAAALTTAVVMKNI